MEISYTAYTFLVTTAKTTRIVYSTTKKSIKLQNRHKKIWTLQCKLPKKRYATQRLLENDNWEIFINFKVKCNRLNGFVGHMWLDCIKVDGRRMTLVDGSSTNFTNYEVNWSCSGCLYLPEGWMHFFGHSQFAPIWGWYAFQWHFSVSMFDFYVNIEGRFIL